MLLKEKNLMKAMECCTKGSCQDCPINTSKRCMRILIKNAFAYLIQKDTEIKSLQDRIKGGKNNA